MFAACWSTPLIVGEVVYVSDEDGDVSIFSLSADPLKALQKQPEAANAIVRAPLHEITMVDGIYTMPVVANNVLYVATKNELFAIAAGTNGARRPAKKGPAE